MIVEATSYGIKTTPQTYGVISNYSFDWTGRGWAIQHLGDRYTHRGDWIDCPQPSSRTEQFYKRTLWGFDEGMAMFKKILSDVAKEEVR